MKNFYIDTKKFTCFFLLILWSLSVLSPLGCSSMPWQVKTVVTYQSVGVTMDEAKTAVLAMCKNGTLDQVDCRKAKHAYNQAVTVYKAMGVAADVAMDTGDDLEYRSLALQLSHLLEVVNSFLVTQ